MTSLVRYDAMLHAIAECHNVDEVKAIHDKALALELYARQAMNMDAERRACEIRIRAEKKAGKLMRAMKRGDKGRPAKNGATVAPISEYQEALKVAGINERTAQRWQELAAVPDSVFEEAMRDPVKPTTTGLIRTMNGSPKMDDGSLWIWGALRDFERRALVGRPFAEVFDGMTESMQIDMRRLVPSMIEWLSQFREDAK